MYIKEAGDKRKPLMILLHGGGVSGWMWRAQEDYFKKNWHLIIPDLPGHGLSAEEKFISVSDCADKLISLINEKKRGKKAVVLGLSLGAQTAVEIISRKTNVADAAVIQSALVIPMPVIKRLLKPVSKISFGLVKNRKFSRLQAKELYIPDALFEQYYEDSKKISVDNFISILDANMSYTLPQGYLKAACPILVMYGDKEKQVMKKSAWLMASNSNAEVYCAQNIGHGFSLADPEEFNQTVDNWLKHII